MHFRFPRPLLLTSFPRPVFLRRSLLNPMGSSKMASSSGDSGDSPLSATDFRTYNRMSEQMEGFVSLIVHFRISFAQFH